jgi:hypothetical protein
MPDVQNFHPAPLRANSVVDAKRCMEEPPNPVETANGRSYEGKLFENIDVIQERISESFGTARMLLPRPSHGNLQVS